MAWGTRCSRSWKICMYFLIRNGFHEPSLDSSGNWGIRMASRGFLDLSQLTVDNFKCREFKWDFCYLLHSQLPPYLNPIILIGWNHCRLVEAQFGSEVVDHYLTGISELWQENGSTSSRLLNYTNTLLKFEEFLIQPCPLFCLNVLREKLKYFQIEAIKQHQNQWTE